VDAHYIERRYRTSGAGLWATNDNDTWKGVFNHICRQMHVSMHLAEELKGAISDPKVVRRLREEQRGDYVKIVRDSEFLSDVATGAWIHDIGKRWDEEQRSKQKLETGHLLDDKHDVIGDVIATRVGEDCEQVRRMDKSCPESSSLFYILGKQNACRHDCCR